MRRIKILLYWLFREKNNISVVELCHFLLKPKVNLIAKQFIKSIHQTDFYEICFYSSPYTLFWPLRFPVEGINQVTAETFDVNDWHYYQKRFTEVEPNEVLLDIGTAEGLFPLTVVDKCEKIIMIEPNPCFHQALQKTFAPFGNKITIIHSAVGNKDGIIAIQGESLNGQVSEDHLPGDELISIQKVDSIITSTQRISYLKADIEGFEQEMLKGAEQTIKRNQPKIAITTYHHANAPAEIIKLIKSFVPAYQYYVKGIYHEACKPVMIHFWV